MQTDRIIVVGIGNILQGDEGAGVHAIRFLKEKQLPTHIDLLEGGTAGFSLLSIIDSYPFIVFIDATMDGKPPGTLSVVRISASDQFPRSLGSHGAGIPDLVQALILGGRRPAIYLILITITEIRNMVDQVSDAVRTSFPRIYQEILSLSGPERPG